MSPLPRDLTAGCPPAPRRRPLKPYFASTLASRVPGVVRKFAGGFPRAGRCPETAGDGWLGKGAIVEAGVGCQAFDPVPDQAQEPQAGRWGTWAAAADARSTATPAGSRTRRRGAAGRGGAAPGGEVAGGGKAGQHHSDPRTPSPPCGDAYSPAAKAQCSCPQNGDQHVPVVDSAESQQILTPTLQFGAGFISRSSGGQQ